MKKLILIQHCQSEHHVNNMTGGWTDSPLTQFGKKQAEIIGHTIKSKIESEEYLLYSSDLQRAWQTATIIGKIINISPIANSGLREINTGEATGMTKEWARINRNSRDPQEEYLDYHEFTGAESRNEFFLRVCDCMEKITKWNENGKNLLIVCHGGSADYITAWWMGYDLEMVKKSYFWGSSGSIHVLEAQGNRHILTKFNDTSHFNVFREC